MGASETRAGDTERERAARLLREHCSEGRLDFDELDTRIEATYSAKTRRELDALLADLPETTQERHVADARLWWPGVTVFHVERQLQSPPSSAYQDALRAIVPRMAIAGFHLRSEIPPRRLDFQAPDGLFVGLQLHTAADGGTDLAAFGRAPRKVRKAFANLRD